MKPKWILQNDIFREGNPEKIAEWLSGNGYDFQFRPLIPFGGMDQQEDLNKLPEKGDCVNTYGSLEFCAWFDRNYNWVPNRWCSLENINCVTYYSHWGKYITQENYCFLPLGEIYRNKDKLFDKFGVDDRIFIRPDSNNKTFNAEVVSRDGFQEFYDYATHAPSRGELTTLSVVSSPVKLDQEWRLVISERKVIAGSQYRVDGLVEMAKGYPREAESFANAVANSNSYDPHPMYVMDVARSGDKYSLVEIGSINSAGLYCCDIDSIMPHWARLSERDWLEIYGRD